MIICLEGPSAAGKTATCQALMEQGNADTIPEVNALFPRPANEAPEWYLECQTARWEIAQRQSRLGKVALLDGDPFQPLWYNWAYDFHHCQSLDVLCAFFRPRIAAGLMGFPDRYVYLLADEAELRRRKEADKTRTRRNFETHLRLIKAQSRYFEEMVRLVPGKVQRIEAESIEMNVKRVQECLTPSDLGISDLLSLFDHLTEWLRAKKS